MGVMDAAEPTPSIPIGPKVLWSNPSARSSAKSQRRERRDRQKMQKLRKNEGTPQSSQVQAYSNVNGAIDTTASSITIPNITLTSATPGKPPYQAPVTTSNTDTRHLKAPTFNPRRRRTPRSRAKATLSPEPNSRLTRAEAKHRSHKLDRLHKQLGHHERYAKKLEEDVSSHVANDRRLGPSSRSEQLARARASVQSDQAAIQELMYARHMRPMTEKEERQSEELAELHHECYRWDMWEKEAHEEFSRTRHTDLEAARHVLKEKGSETYRATTPVLDMINEVKRELGFGSEDYHIPADPANGIFSMKMLEESRWSREEKLACAKHYVARWGVELQIWEKRIPMTEGLDRDPEMVEHSICKAQSSLKYFRSKVNKFSDPKLEELKEIIGEEDRMEVQPKNSIEMDEGMNELVEGVERL